MQLAAYTTGMAYARHTNDAAEGIDVKEKSHETPSRTSAKVGKLLLAGHEVEGISIGGQVH